MNRSENSHDEAVLVVGSGPAGAMAAARLVGRGMKVTLLDAGLSAPRGLVVRAGGNTVFRWKDMRFLETDRHDHEPGAVTDWASSRSLGGLTNYWTAAVPRFAPEDFTEGRHLDERYEWPVSYTDLVPYYEMAEAALVITAGQPFANFPENTTRFRCRPPADWADLAARAEPFGHHMGPLPMAKGSPWMVAARHRVQQLPQHRGASAVIRSVHTGAWRAGHSPQLEQGRAAGRVRRLHRPHVAPADDDARAGSGARRRCSRYHHHPAPVGLGRVPRWRWQLARARRPLPARSPS